MEQPIDYGAAILAAVSREKALRDAAWVGGVTEVCGKKILPMTFRHYLALTAIESPFITGHQATPEALVQFLWVLSPDFSDATGRALAFTIGCRPLPYAEAVGKCWEYVETTFLDAPQGAGKSDGSPDYYSWAASIVDVFGSEYGWTTEAAMEVPLRQAFQLLRVIKRRQDPKAVMFNPLSDAAKLAWVKSLNQKAA